MSNLTISALKVENWSLFFKYRINRAIKQKEKRKRGDGKKEKIKKNKKNLHSLGFYIVFDCIRDLNV